MSIDKFTGFSKETFSFLKELKLNNNKLWFDKNKQRFKEHVESPAIAFMNALCMVMEAKLKNTGTMRGKIFRIYRDIRFSKDKRPYKTHIGIRFSERMEKGCAGPIFYSHIVHDSLSLVTGVKEMDGETLELFRRGVSDDKTGRSLEKILEALKKKSFLAKGEVLNSIPRGYESSHPRAGLLRSKGLYVEWEGGLPEEIHGPEFIKFCLDRFAETKPLYDWLKKL